MTSPAKSTVVAELTPPGRGAVAVVAVAGPQCLAAIGNNFHAQNGRQLAEIAIGRIAFGHWAKPNGEEVVLCRHTDDELEIHCHGGIAAIEAIIGQLVSAGCERITWQQWVERSTTDPIQAAAQVALARATTERTAAILLDQLNGSLRRDINATLAAITATDWPTAERIIGDLLNREDIGRHLTNRWQIVVFGPPNVGKSSLLNALAGYSRAIVSPIPGTTRDVVTLTTAFDGWAVQLSDTAGFRTTDDELESAGIELATGALARAELALFVHDASALRANKLTGASPNLPNVPTCTRALHIVNKIDLVPVAERSALVQQFRKTQPSAGPPLCISALNNEGVTELIATIVEALVPQPIPPETAVPFSNDHIEALSAARAAISQRDPQVATSHLLALLTKTA